MEDILRETRQVPPDRDNDFNVRDMTQVANAMASATTVMTGMLGAVAAVSLLVGGIGIMNIMLVSVTERLARLAFASRSAHMRSTYWCNSSSRPRCCDCAAACSASRLGWRWPVPASWTLSIPFVPTWPWYSWPSCSRPRSAWCSDSSPPFAAKAGPYRRVAARVASTAASPRQTAGLHCTA